jgi:DNA replication protein DnaC
MTAFLKIDECEGCGRSLPWEWVPAVGVNGKALAGTGVWRSVLASGRCPACVLEVEKQRQEAERAMLSRQALTSLLGGAKPYREFTLERYQVGAENRRAYEGAANFDPTVDNLYLWGACGVGKTHLAYAIARRAFEESLSVEILRPWQLVRKARMKEPDVEQQIIDQLSGVHVLVLDDMGSSGDSLYGRHLLQEILDSRDYQGRAGLVVTSPYGLNALAEKFGDDRLASRVAGMCRVIEVAGTDRRLDRPLYHSAQRTSGATDEHRF